jgi:hypothetical protein
VAVVLSEFVYRRGTALAEAPGLQLEEDDLAQLFPAVRVSAFLHTFEALLGEKKVILLSSSLR